MINAIADLGKYAFEKNPTDILDMVMDDAYDNGKNKHLLIIAFEKRENQNLLFSPEKDWQFEEKVLDEIYDIELERDVVFDAKIFSKKLINTSLYQAMPFVREVLDNGVEI